MLLDRGQHTKAEVMGDVNMSQSMGFNLNASSFELILKNLYQDAPSAIIRELCTNAYEANIASGTDKKVLIELPNFISNDLIIRDFGTGLDYDEVMKYLNVLFSSSKSETEDALGGFGLGSKSPLAVVDSFYLDSIKNGKKHSFIWVKESGKVPTPIYNGATDTDEPSGIKVTVPLGSSTKISLPTLNSTIKKAANKALLGFEEVIKIVEDCSVPYDQLEDITYKILEKKCVFSQDGVNFYTTNDSFNNTCYVRVGTVTYPLPHNSSYEIQNILAKYVTNSKDYTIVLDIPPSTLDIPMSREYLETSSNNTAIISKTINSYEKVIQNLKDSLKIDNTLNLFQFHKQQAPQSTVSGLKWRLKLSYSLFERNNPDFVKLFKMFCPNISIQTVYQSYGWDQNNIEAYTYLLRNYCKCLKIIQDEAKQVNASLTSYEKPKDDDVLFLTFPLGIINNKTKILSKFLKKTYPNRFVYIFKEDNIENGNSQTYKIFSDLFKEYLDTLECDVLSVSYTDIKEDFEAFKVDMKTTNTVVTTQEKFAGVYYTKYNDNKILQEVNKRLDGNYYLQTFDRHKHCINKKLTSSSTTVPLGSNYFDEEEVEIVLLSTDGLLPIKCDSKRLPHATLDKELMFLRVPSTSYNITLKRLLKDGFTVYHKENILELEAPSIESVIEHDPSDANYTTLCTLMLNTFLNKYLYRFSCFERWSRSKLNPKFESFMLEFVEVLKQEKDLDLYKTALEKNINSNLFLNPSNTPVTFDKEKQEVLHTLFKDFCIQKVLNSDTLAVPDYLENDILKEVYEEFGFKTLQC